MRKQARWILLIILVVISAQVLSAQTNVSGEVSGIWELANSPYIVVGDISIVGDSLLVIEAGVEVRFDGFYQFFAYGVLSAIGTESEPILFTSNATTPNPSDWYNIELSDFCIMQHCIVEYAGQPEPYSNRFAIRLNGDCEIKNNIIRHNAVTGIGAMFEASLIKQNLIYENNSAFFAGSGIYSQWSSARIENNTIVDNPGAGMWLQANSDSLTVINNIIVNNGGVGFQYDQVAGSPFPIADYNDVWGNTPNYQNLSPGAHSISEDPLFVGTGDYHLTADSPCIDAGDPAYLPDPDGTIADLGAYPFYQDFEIDVTDLSYATFTGGEWLTEDQIIDEGDSLNFFIVASDPNGNDLEYEWLLDGEEVSIESTYSFLTNESSAGEYEVTLFVTDNAGSRNELNYLWNITVNDVDQSIVVTELIPPEGNIVIDEGDVINFSIDAYDPDGNNLEYSWQVEGVEVSVVSTFDFITDENSSGEYEVILFVTDNFGARDELNFLWNVTVNDVSGTGSILTPVITKLRQNYPNPFNPTTTIYFTTEGAENAKIVIYNLKGQKIKKLEIRNLKLGINGVVWNGTDENDQAVSSGIYLYKLNVNGKSKAMKKCLLMK